MRCASAICGQTMTLTAPVSSSRVTKTVPLAVSGRCRCVTRPLARASRPFGKVRSARAGSIRNAASCAPQQRERMAVQRQAEGAVVGQRLLALARRGERDRGLVDARRAQHLGRPGVDAGDRPGRLVAVAGEALQRVGLGERRERVGVEAGAARQVFGAGEARFGARRDDALADVLRPGP